MTTMRNAMVMTVSVNEEDEQKKTDKNDNRNADLS